MMIAELSEVIDLHQRCMPRAPEQLTLHVFIALALLNADDDPS